ncbi:lysine--tRNA ligase, partial [Candidatus Woesearchaeota archaeon]
GINPYPYKYEPTYSAAKVQEEFSKLEKEEKTDKKVRIAGRIMSLRRMGKATFMHVMDQTGKVQAYFKFDEIGENYNLLKLMDIGDWIGIEGIVFKTKTGEVTVRTEKFEILSKSIRPLPDKWSGLKDIEQRYRKRYLDLIMNPDVRNVFLKRTKIINSIRQSLNKKGFLEVETPVLQPVYGGANARPFKTHLHSLDMDVYLRISNELYLKRLIIGGYEKVFEFARDFRNEDIDRTHNPEFTQIEIYEAFADFNDMQNLVMDLFVNAAKEIHGSTRFEYQGHKIDVKKPWQKFTMIESLREIAGIDVEKLDEKELLNLCRQHNVELEDNPGKGDMIQGLFDELVEKKLIQPTFITDYPVESTPFCKVSRKDPDSCYIERFEVFIAGMEVGNAYSELNDPVVQKKLLEEQAARLRAGSEEAHPMDKDFVQAVEYGMPPTGGVGIGIDRMTMLLTNQKSIRDVIFFPFMKQ